MPIQCNACGAKMWPAARLADAKRRGWTICLDGAGAAATSAVDCQALSADFMTLSFYKMFGWPDGLAALICSAEGAAELLRSDRGGYFAGGTVVASTTEPAWHQLKGTLARFEDGSLPFLSIRALEAGMAAVARVGGLAAIRRHVLMLGAALARALRSLRHANGAPVVRVFGWEGAEAEQGGTVLMELLDAAGQHVPHSQVARFASLRGIGIRTGNFCNPGCTMDRLGLAPADVRRMVEESGGEVVAARCWSGNDRLRGGVRVSLGYPTRAEEVARFVELVRDLFVDPGAAEVPAPVAVERRGTVESVSLYPIKSCGAFSPTHSWRVTATGLQHDREWVLYDVETARIMTMRHFPELVHVRPTIDVEAGTMEVRAPGLAPLRVALGWGPPSAGAHAAVAPAGEGPQIDICGTVAAEGGLVYAEEVNAWFTQACGGHAVRLVRRRRAEKAVSYANQSPLLVVSRASVAALAELAPGGDADVSVARFRPNIVVAGAADVPAWDEDSWTRIVAEEGEISISGPCNRCSMVCIDPETGRRAAEPLRTLSKSRRDGSLVLFGMHAASASEGAWELGIGTEVRIDAASECVV